MTVLVGLLFFGILTLWVQGRWALSAVQAGVFLLAARSHRNTSVLLIPLCGAVIWGLIQLATGRTIYRWATEEAVLNWTANLAVFWAALQLLRETPVRRRFLSAVLWFGFALSVVASVQRFSPGGKIFWLFDSGYDTPLMGPFVYENQYAAFFEMIMPIALLGALEDRARSLGYVVMAAVMMASLVAAASVAGAALVALETPLILLLAWRGRRLALRRTVLAAVAVLLLLFGAVVGWQPLAQKLERATPYRLRLQLLTSTIEMARERPGMGFGLGTWSLAYPSVARFDDGVFENQAHNDWAQWAAEGGVPFLLLMLFLAAALVRPAVRSLWGVGLLCVLAHCGVDYHFQQRPAFGYFFFALAGAVAAEDSERSRLRGSGG